MVTAVNSTDKSSSTTTTAQSAPSTSASKMHSDNGASSSKDSAPAVKSDSKTQSTPSSMSPTDTATAIEGSKDAEASKGDKARAASRFRRDPVTSRKIKGTLVAEFPQRLLVQYSSNGSRDPFATLIDQEKQTKSPIEKRIPNVEGLSLVGVIETGFGNNRALLEDKEGYGYIMQSGDKVQKGYVLRVEDDKVYFQIFEYGWSRTVALGMIEKD